jgi:hypothetical protein
MSRLLQTCIAVAAHLPAKLTRGVLRPIADDFAELPEAYDDTAAPGRDGVLGSDPYGLWALNDFLSSGNLSRR